MPRPLAAFIGCSCVCARGHISIPPTGKRCLWPTLFPCYVGMATWQSSRFLSLSLHFPKRELSLALPPNQYSINTLFWSFNIASSNLLSRIQHIVVLMLENRSFDSMLGFLYADLGNKSPSGQPFEGLTGKEANPDPTGKSIPVFEIGPTDKNSYFMPGTDPGEGYAATNSQLFGSVNAPTPPDATNQGFVKDFSYTLGWEKKTSSWAKQILPGTVAQNI